MLRFVRSLRFRLAAAFFLCTAAIQLLLLLILPSLRSSLVMAELDALVEDHALAILQRAAPDGAPNRATVIETLRLFAPTEFPAGFAIQVRDADGAVLAAAGATASALPFKPAAQTTFETVPHPVALRPGEPSRRSLAPIRTATVRVGEDRAPETYLQVGVSLAAADPLKGVLERLMALSLLAGVGGAAIGGWVVAGLVVSRLDRIGRAVREVSPTRLERRIDLPVGHDEIGRLAADVNSMLDRLAAAFRSQENFISEVSHELKTPVSVLLTEAQVLKYIDRTEGDYKSFVGSVEDEMRRLGKMVESFLMLARFRHGRRFVAEGFVPINDAALDSVEHSSLLASQHGVNVNLTLYDAGENQPEALVRGDGELLRVVIDNLIRNAIQVSRRGSSVDVDIAREGDRVVVTVADHGPGVPPEYVERIFDRFAQAPSTSTRRGTGLGLTIAKGVVDLHGGAISVRNAPAGGCIFTVRLPLAEVTVSTPTAVKPPTNLPAVIESAHSGPWAPNPVQ